MTVFGRAGVWIREKYLRGRKPGSIVSDLLFVALIILLLIPGTRGVLLRGAAGIRTWVTRTEVRGGGERLGPDEWSWSMRDMEGNVLPFGSLKGEVIFLNQWATWCPPCRAELPSIEKLYRKVGDHVKFVLLTSEDPAKVKDFLERHGFDFPVYFGQVSGGVLSVRTIPSTVIINRDGGVEMRHTGALNWNAGKIRRLVGKLVEGR
jgi:thiol-disulfide isomerase/thioredoxin